MARKRRHPASKRKGGEKRDTSTVSLRPVAGTTAWSLVHPRCARDRAEDIEEVRFMIEAGEVEVAIDELRWLLSGCSDCLDAHLLLGELAINHHNDLQLARGHLGYAYQLGLRAWRRAGEPVPVPYTQPANRTFHEAGRALAWCLEKLGKPVMADEVVSALLRLDPTDPLEVRKMIDDFRTDAGSLPIL